MTQIYTPPTANDTLGLYEIFKYVNNTSEGLLFVSLLFVIWIITFVATKSYSASRAWTFASFLCFILSLILSVIGIIAPKFMYLYLILTGVGAVWLKLEAEG